MFFCLKNITSFLFATTISVTAEDFIYDGIAYRILPDEPATVEVTRSEGITYSGSIAIPAEITYSSETYQVKGIGDGAFLCCDGLQMHLVNGDAVARTESLQSAIESLP